MEKNEQENKKKKKKGEETVLISKKAKIEERNKKEVEKDHEGFSGINGMMLMFIINIYVQNYLKQFFFEYKIFRSYRIRPNGYRYCNRCIQGRQVTCCRLRFERNLPQKIVIVHKGLDEKGTVEEQDDGRGGEAIHQQFFIFQ